MTQPPLDPTSALALDPLTWGQLLFPHHFKARSPLFHTQMIMAAQRYNKLAVASPRRSAKSTLLLFLFPFHELAFKRRHFIVIISNTFKKAAMHLDAIKKEVAENLTLRTIHPPITMPRDAEGDTIFRHPDGFETLVLCKGVDQIGSLRGVKFGPHRPDLVLGDDMEDDELVRSIERRAQLQEDFDSVLIPIGGMEPTKHLYVGTVLHDDCLLAKLVSKDHYPDYHKLFLKAHLDPDGPNEASLWPENWSLDYLRQLRKDKPNVYAKEMQNDPVAGSNARFKRENFKYYRHQGEKVFLLGQGSGDEHYYSLRDCRAAIACDLAWKEKRESDNSVIMPGLITPNSEILVFDYISKKGMRPDELAEQLFILTERLERFTGSVVPVGFEKAMLENVTKWLLKREMQKRNRFLLTKELVWDADKNTRIETRLQTRYVQGVIYHKQGMGDLEYQLERFPYGTHDDLIDALQGLVQLLQYPKNAPRFQPEEDTFMRVRQHMIDAKNPRPPKHRYSGRSKFPFPVTNFPL